MLKSLDILIGLVVILVALSMAVTVITQCVTATINSRGRHLRRGLVDLLQQLDPTLTQTLSVGRSGLSESTRSSAVDLLRGCREAVLLSERCLTDRREIGILHFRETTANS